MLVIEHYHPSALVLTLSGRFDQKGDMALETAMLRGEEKKVLHVVFNLEQISTIDTAGIGRMYVTFFRLKQKGIYLSLVNPKPAVRKVLNLVEIPKVIHVFESEEAALAWQGTSPPLSSNPIVPHWGSPSDDDSSKPSAWSHKSPTEASA